MKKAYLITSLLLGSLVLVGCDNDEPGTSQKEEGDVEIYSIDPSEKTYASPDASSEGGSIEVEAGKTTGALGGSVNFTVTVNEGFELRAIRFNDVEIDINTRTVTPTKGSNTLEADFCEIGYHPYIDGLLDFKFTAAEVATTKNEILSDAEDFRKNFFDSKIFDNKDGKFAVENIFLPNESNANKTGPYIRFGSRSGEGLIQTQLSADAFSTLKSINVSVIPYYNVFTDGSGKVSVDKSEFTIDGKNYKALETNFTTKEAIKPTVLTFTAEEISSTNGLLKFGSRNFETHAAKSGRSLLDYIQFNF